MAAPLLGFTVGVTADRRKEEQAELLRRLGARVVHGPTVRTLPLAHDQGVIDATEQLVFPELNPDKYTRPQGMSITLCTSVDSDDEARELLRKLGMPFRREEAA